MKERIDKLTVLGQRGYMSEAVILACCYLDALGYFRYLPNSYQSRRTFITFLLRYAKDGDLAKVSLPILARTMNSTQNPQASRLLAWIERCKTGNKRLSSRRTILRKFKSDFSDPSELINEVRDAMLVSIFYDNVRSLGVHQGRFLVSTRASIEVGGIGITASRILGWLNASFQNVLPYLQCTHRWIRFGKYA